MAVVRGAGRAIHFGYTPVLTEHVARWLHEHFCGPNKFGHLHEGCPGFDEYYWTRKAGFLIASALPRMGELFEVIRADERDRARGSGVGCTFDCSHCHQDCEGWGCEVHEAAG